MSKQCKISWCNNKAASKDWCITHYQHWLRTGDAAPPSLAKLVGTRTLLAKSCASCGELKMADAFRRVKRSNGKFYKQSYCKPCIRIYNQNHGPKMGSGVYSKLAYHKLTPEQKKKRQNDLKTMNSEMRDTADQLFQPWTQADIDFALDPANGTLRERAIKLGRTFKGVASQVQKHQKRIREEMQR